MKNLSDLKKDFNQIVKNYNSDAGKLPRIVGDIAVKTIRENFLYQRFDEPGGTKWKDRTPGTDKSYTQGRGKGGKSKYKRSVFNASNPILIQTGNLRSGIKYIVQGNKIDIGVNLNIVPYAKIHNEGGRIMAWGKTWVTMPKRKYLGYSKKLDFLIKLAITKLRINSIGRMKK
jgi:phage gpG-like protein